MDSKREESLTYLRVEWYLLGPWGKDWEILAKEYKILIKKTVKISVWVGNKFRRSIVQYGDYS